MAEVVVFMGAVGDLAEVLTAADSPEVVASAVAVLAPTAAAMADIGAVAALVGMDAVIPATADTVARALRRDGEGAQEVDGQAAVAFRMPL